MNNSVWTTGLIGQRMGSLRYIQNNSLKLNDHWHWWMVMFRAMPIEILTAKLSLLCKNTNKWLSTTTNISQHLYFFVVWLTEYWSWSLTIILQARLAYNFSSFTAAVGQTHFFSIWQTIAREYVQGSLFHFPLPLPLTYKCPQSSNPTKLGSPVFHAEKVSATAVPSSHSKTLSPLGAIIPSRGSPFRSIKLKRKAFSAADLMIGRVAPSCLHR